MLLEAQKAGHMNEDEFMNAMEEMVRQLFQEVLGHQLPAAFPRMTYTEAVAQLEDGDTLALTSRKLMGVAP